MPQQEAVFKFTEDWVAYKWDDSKYATSEYLVKLDEELSEKEGVVDYKALNEILNGYCLKKNQLMRKQLWLGFIKVCCI